MDILNNKRNLIALLGVLLLIVALGIGLYLVQQKQIFLPKAYQNNSSEIPMPSSPENSFSLTGSQEVSKGEKVHVILVVRADTEEANLFAAKIKFPTDLLSVDAINVSNDPNDTSGSGYFIKNWVEKYYDNIDGDISLVGGVPAPGLRTMVSNPPLAMADIIFTAKNTGKADIVFNADSAIYRNSDNFNILTIKRELNIDIQPEETAATCTPCASDINKDGKVDEKDFVLIQACFGKDAAMTDDKGNYCKLADVNGNGSIEIQDVSCLRSEMGQSCTSPTPIATSSATPTVKPNTLLGDVNIDGAINLIDMSALLSRMGKGGQEAGYADLNTDSIVNSFDYAKMINILLERKVIRASK